MPFKFRLQPLLELRRRREEAAQIELASAQRVLADAERRQRSLEEKRAQQMSGLRALQTRGRVDFQSVLQGFAHLETLNSAIAAQTIAVANARAVASEKRERLVKAMQDRKALEKLKERAKERYLTEQNRREAAVLEESSIAQFHRQRRAQA